jgi:hypothetical protein
MRRRPGERSVVQLLFSKGQDACHKLICGKNEEKQTGIPVFTKLPFDRFSPVRNGKREWKLL